MLSAAKFTDKSMAQGISGGASPNFRFSPMLFAVCADVFFPWQEDFACSKAKKQAQEVILPLLSSHSHFLWFPLNCFKLHSGSPPFFVSLESSIAPSMGLFTANHNKLPLEFAEVVPCHKFTNGCFWKKHT